MTNEEKIEKLTLDMLIFDYVITTLVEKVLTTSERNQLVEMMTMMRNSYNRGEYND